MGLANYYRSFVEGYAELAAPFTALGSPTARFTWTAAAHAISDALMQTASSAPVLRTFDLLPTSWQHGAAVAGTPDSYRRAIRVSRQ